MRLSVFDENTDAQNLVSSEFKSWFYEIWTNVRICYAAVYIRSN